jgi:two-component sensor histidine kinase
LHAQARQAAEPETAGALRAAAGRVRVMGRVHERLSAQRRTGPATADAAVADSRLFIEGLVADLRAGVEGARPVSLTVAAEAHLLPLAAMADIGLVVNELVTNALKHAFPGEREGLVRVAFRCEGGTCELVVADNGVGMPAAAGEEAVSRLGRASSTDRRGQGDRLLRALAAQLGGRLEVTAGEVGGTICRLRFPMPASAASGAAPGGEGWSEEEDAVSTDPADLARFREQRPRAAPGPGG